MGKVAGSAASITRTLWGDRGRPETNDYADRCAAQLLAKSRATGKSLVVVEEIKPKDKRMESRRTESKWAAARARATKGGK